MQAIAGGNWRYPSLQAIADLFRFQINDTFSSTTGSGTGSGGGAGLIMPNSNPDMITLLDSSIRELYSDLRNVGDPELILDNYILTGLPALSQADQTVQVSIGYQGFFDGFQWHSEFTLPTSVARVLALWERTNNSQEDFFLMTECPNGLPAVLQGNRMIYWEMRQGQIWMPGALLSTDIRIRARITYPDFLSPVSVNYSTSYVPILDAQNAIAAKMLVKYAMRFAPERYQLALAEEQRLMMKLRLETTRQRQRQVNQRMVYAGDAGSDIVPAATWL